MLDILFLLHIGKDWFLESKLSVVVPQAIGISLCNRIGDTAGEFLVVVLWGLFYWHSMNLIALSILFLCQVWGHVCLVESDWSEFCLSLPVCLFLCTFFFLYAGFWFTVVYTRSFLYDYHVYTRVYYEQSRIPWIFPFLWKLIGCWVNAVSCWVSFGTSWFYFDLCFWPEMFFLA